jgi:hypothetical protein
MAMTGTVVVYEFPGADLPAMNMGAMVSRAFARLASLRSEALEDSLDAFLADLQLGLEFHVFRVAHFHALVLQFREEDNLEQIGFFACQFEVHGCLLIS